MGMEERQSTENLRISGLTVLAEATDGERPARLADVELSLSRGEWLYLVGANGSGKSTLARIAAGLSEPGAVGAMRRGFAGELPSAYVMQQPDAQLFGETPREEVAFALEWQGLPADEIAAATERGLERVGLLGVADLPWQRLSGGQRQLAAVAAAAAAGAAPLIVYDEATSMLDSLSARRVREFAEAQYAAGTAVVWVTQRLEELRTNDRVITMAEGRIAYDGSVRDFLYGQEKEGGESVEIAMAGAGGSLQTVNASDSGALTAVPPCLLCGLRLPYRAAMARELRSRGHWSNPLPVTDEEWRNALVGKAGCGV